MAKRRDTRENRRKDPLPWKHMAEKRPTPHGESKVLEMPIKTDQRNDTRGKNVAQNPNTAGGKLNPSVAHEFPARAATGTGEAAPARGTRAPRHRKQNKG
jgi:hypothetical protein